MYIDIKTGSLVHNMLKAPEFLREWTELYTDCPWRTVFQSVEFVTTWYMTYSSIYEPVIITGRNEFGELRGIFTLAAHKESADIVVAGKNLAEYHTWLSYPDDGDSFIEEGLDSLAGLFPGKRLLFLFILENAPLDWARNGKRWAGRCSVRPHPRGLMPINDGKTYRDILRKKKQSKINRLKRLGSLRFERLNQPAELEAIFDEFNDYQTLRMRAVHGLPEEEPDELRKSFYANLMKIPKMVHTTVLWLDEKMVSAQIHMYNGEEVLLNLITHAPFYARHSPGELHVYMLAAELGDEGVPMFDLTPGGDYKDRYAADYDTAYALEVFFNRKDYIFYRFKRMLIDSAGMVLRIFNLNIEEVKRRLSMLADRRRKLQRFGFAGAFAHFIGKCIDRIWHQKEYLVYRYDVDQNENRTATKMISRNQVSELLKYQPQDFTDLPVNAFFSSSLESFAAGNAFYSYTINDNLAHYAWLIEKPVPSILSEAEIEVGLEQGDAMISGFKFAPEIQTPELYRSSLQQMIHDAAVEHAAKSVIICIPSGNTLLRNAAEATGFGYRYSIFEKYIFGRRSIRTGKSVIVTSHQIPDGNITSDIVSDAG